MTAAAAASAGKTQQSGGNPSTALPQIKDKSSGQMGNVKQEPGENVEEGGDADESDPKDVSKEQLQRLLEARDQRTFSNLLIDSVCSMSPGDFRRVREMLIQRLVENRRCQHGEAEKDACGLVNNCDQSAVMQSMCSSVTTCSNSKLGQRNQQLLSPDRFKYVFHVAFCSLAC